MLTTYFLSFYDLSYSVDSWRSELHSSVFEYHLSDQNKTTVIFIYVCIFTTKVIRHVQISVYPHPKILLPSYHQNSGHHLLKVPSFLKINNCFVFLVSLYYIVIPHVKYAIVLRFQKQQNLKIIT